MTYSEETKKAHEDLAKLKNVATSAHVVITKLCRETYGDKRKNWPEKAKETLDMLDLWGCHP
jgi:hypothetical protein